MSVLFLNQCCYFLTYIVLFYYDKILTFNLGHNQLIVPFTSAAYPNLELKNMTFLGWKNGVPTTTKMRL